MSPDEASASHEYEQGWNAINELIRSDGTWSGYERNVFYANNRDGTFSDVSGVVGLDFVEDGRAFALADFDHDGRLEVFLKNRNAPQLRILKNVMEELPPSIAFRLQGTKSNRDAIGATVTIETASGRQTRMLQAGSGFLSQHSKDVFFGLGDAKGPLRASIRWPSGLMQELHDLPVNHRVWVKEGSEPLRVEPFKKPATSALVSEASGERETIPSKVETWLLAPIASPDFSLPDRSGQVHSLSSTRGKPVILNFWTAKSPESREELTLLQKSYADWTAKGLQLLTVNLDDPTGDEIPTFAQSLTFPILRGSEDVAAIYNILYRQLFDRHRDLTLPTSFLIDGDGNIVKVYQGPIVPERVEQDFQAHSADRRREIDTGFAVPEHEVLARIWPELSILRSIVFSARISRPSRSLIPASVARRSFERRGLIWHRKRLFESKQECCSSRDIRTRAETSGELSGHSA